MKKSLFFFFSMFFLQYGHAEFVPENVAISVATNFIKLKKHSSDRHIQIKDFRDVYYKGILTSSIVNFEGGGWMIVARDDRSVPVLAYNPTGQFEKGISNKSNTPGEDFLNHYNQTIYHKAVTEKGNLTKNVKWVELDRMDFLQSRTFDTPVPPLLASSSNWSDGYPYWAGLPEGLSTENTCVPMAISQFVKFWQHPYQPVGIETYDGMTINFDMEEPYNFDIMPYALADPEFPYTPYFDENSPEALEVGRLQYHGWFIAHMKNTYGSGLDGVGFRMVSHYGYRPDFSFETVLQNHPRFIHENFKTKIRSDLDASHPILASWAGHAFVIDGYQDDGTNQGNYDYFHLVLGWGTDEGFYYFFAEDDDGQHSYPEGGRDSRYEAYFNLIPNDDPCFIKPGQPTYIISNGEQIVWDTPKGGIESIVIEAGGELTIRSKVAFKSGGMIIVNRGARLIVDGGELSTCNDEQWTGIKLKGNANLEQPEDPYGPLNPNKSGIVIFTNALLENVYQAVSCDNEYLGSWQARADNFGGLIIGENSTFQNGFRGIEIMQYYFPNNSYFNGCTFDDLNLGVTVWNNDEIEFHNCTFSNIERDAIYGIDAGVKVLSGNTFLNCTYGVRNLATAAGMSKLKIGDPDTYGNVFEECYNAVYMSQQDDHFGLVDVANNTFVDNWDDVLLYGENSYNIYQNDFYKGNGNSEDKFSVFGRATGFDANDINCNYFQSIGRKDILMGYKNDHTTFLGNDFSAGNDNFTLYGHQIDPSQPGTILPVIGSKTEPARNCFNGDDIITYPLTREFDYWAFVGVHCEVPLNYGNYNPEYTNDNYEQCIEGSGSFPVTEEQANTWINDYCNRLHITDLPPNPDDFEAYLKELAIFKRKYFRILGKYLKLLGEENQDDKILETLNKMCDCESKRKLFGFYLKRGRLSEARATLERNMCDSTKSDTLFKKIQMINLKWNENLEQRRLYIPTSLEIEFLRNTAISAYPESGSAQALLYLLTGQWEQAPIEVFEGRRESLTESEDQIFIKVQLFPNPASDKLFIDLSSSEDLNSTLYVYNVYGILVKMTSLQSSVTNRIDIGQLNPGIYFCIVRNDHDLVIIQEKVVIQR